MKVLLIALFVAAVSAVPIPDEDGGAVEMIVNGVPEGEALDIGEIVDIRLKEHTNGAVVTSNLLHPYTAVGIAEAAAAAAAAEEPIIPVPVVLPTPVAPEIEAFPQPVIPEPVVLPAPVAPEVSIPTPVVLPAPAAPEVNIPAPVVLPAPVAPEVVIPEPVVLPPPAAPGVLPAPVVLPEPVLPEVILPEPVVLPSPATPEVVSPAEVIPSPAAQESAQNGEIYNDGLVSVTVNRPEEATMLSTLQSWFNMVINYFGDNGVQTTQHIV